MSMKNRNYLKWILSLICCMLMASCNLIDFSEDCTYYGDVELKPDWSVLAKDETKPLLTDIYLLSPQRNYTYSITSDTLVTGIQAVSYIFDENKDAVQHRIMYMYNPDMVQSAFHESQNYILTYQTVRFFDRWGY